MGSPWLPMGSYLVRMKRTAYIKLFKHLPGLQEPIFGPKIRKNMKYR